MGTLHADIAAQIIRGERAPFLTRMSNWFRVKYLHSDIHNDAEETATARVLLLLILVLTWVDFNAVRLPVNRRAVQVLEGESLEPVER
jgi:hypothetical protein